jgi:hypothetical protein
MDPFKYLLNKTDSQNTASSLYDLIGQGGFTANDAFLNATQGLDPRAYDNFVRSDAGQNLLGYDLYEEDPERALRIAKDTAFTTFGDRNLPDNLVEMYTQAARDAGRTGSPSEMRQFIAQSLASNAAYAEPRTVNEYDRRNAGLMGSIMFNPDGTKSGRFDVGKGIAASYNKLKEDNLAGKYAQLLV